MTVQPSPNGPTVAEAFAAEAEANGVDPVLTALGEAESAYLGVRDDLDRRLGELARAETERDRALEAQRAADDEIHRLRGELAREKEASDEAERLRDQVAREKKRIARLEERSRQLADALKHIHQAVFDGNVYKLILRACMSITGATRGLYVTTWKDNLRIRAAVDIDHYPSAPPSEYLKALCRRAEERNDTIVVDGPGDPDATGLPEPKPGEVFRNFIVAPAVIMKHFSGIVLLADKADGPFDEDDVDMVLGIGKQGSVAVENRRLQDELLGAYFSVVGVLADAVEAKDPYTRGHCELVSRYARRTAEKLGLGAAERSVVVFGGLLHDVGKIGVSDGVLNKPGKLMPEEWDLMRSHVRIGRDLLARVPALAHVADVVMHHHERYDGGGYPDGLGAGAITMASRIICVADAYCAMISKRCYKESMTAAEARAELLACRGTHFDPDVVDAFVAVLAEPEEQDDAPDRHGVSASHYHPLELEHALERPATDARRGG